MALADEIQRELQNIGAPRWGFQSAFRGTLREGEQAEARAPLNVSMSTREGRQVSGVFYYGVELISAPAWIAMPTLPRVAGIPAILKADGTGNTFGFSLASVSIPILVTPTAKDRVASLTFRLTLILRYSTTRGEVGDAVVAPGQTVTVGANFDVIPRSGTGNPTNPTDPNPVIDPDPADDSGGTATNATRLTWWQARFLAFNGYKIRRTSWVDRYLEYAIGKGLWLLQLQNAVTGVLGARAVVNASEFREEDFRATDWLCIGRVPDALLADARAITFVLP